MQDLIDFIDYYTLDSRLYFQVPQSKEEGRVEVQWMGPGLWRFKETEAAFWFEVSSEDLIEALEDIEADLGEVERQMFNITIEQIVGASYIVQAGKDFFGDEMVDGALEQYEKFRQEILETLDEVENEKKKPKLSLVKPVDKKD